MNSQCQPRLFPSAIELLESRIAPATFMVTSLLDDITTPDTLRDAINKANTDVSTADTITFRSDVIGKILLDGALQAIPIRGPLTIKGPGASKLSISGGDGIRIFFIDEGEADPAILSPVAISGLSLIDGGGGTNGGALYSEEPLTLTNVVVASSSVNTSGGGLYVDTLGKVVITGSSFLGNSAPDSGGGLFVKAEGGIVISKTTIADNEAGGAAGALQAGGGGVLYSLGANGISLDHVSVLANTAEALGGGLIMAVGSGSISIKNSLIAGNITSAGSGGGLYRTNGSLTVTKTTFSNNTAVTGGALGAHILITDPITLSKVLFANNVSTSATVGGGAIYSGKAALTITSNQFLHNVSAAYGGAMYSDAAGTIKISSSLFAGNTAGKNGGAISFDAAVDLTLKGNVFSSNRAVGGGGAISTETGATVTVTGGSFLDNAADIGGAIYAHGNAPDVVTLSVTGALFQSNWSNSGGGAVYVSSDVNSTFKSIKFINNGDHATGYGGALNIDCNAGSTFDIIGSLFRGNVAENGGAVFAHGPSSMTITSTSFFDNAADFRAGTGGAIDVVSSAVSLSKVTISGNSAYAGGGIYNSAGTVSYNPADTKITGNYASTDPDTSGV